MEDNAAVKTSRYAVVIEDGGVALTVFGETPRMTINLSPGDAMDLAALLSVQGRRKLREGKRKELFPISEKIRFAVWCADGVVDIHAVPTGTTLVLPESDIEQLRAALGRDLPKEPRPEQISHDCALVVGDEFDKTA